MNNQNTITKSLFDFKPISSKFENWAYKEVKKDDSLIILKELELVETYAFRSAVGDAAHATRAAELHLAVDDTTYWKTYQQAKEEFEKTRKIKGFEILNLRTMDKLWVSHYDVKLLFNNKE